MITLGKWITKHKNIILLAAVILLVPSAIGYVTTRVNYDVLSYLPATLETVEGQDILVDEFGMGAFSMVIAEGMTMKEAADLEKQIEGINHVTDVLWYDDFLDISVPTEMMPKKLQDAFFNGDATMMISFPESSYVCITNNKIRISISVSSAFICSKPCSFIYYKTTGKIRQF